MLTSKKNGSFPTVAGLLASVFLTFAPPALQAATNTFNFSNTSLGVNVGPVNPVNGPVAFYATNLNVGDVLVFDGIVINNSPSASGDWAGVSFNGNGTGGVTGAVLGILLRDGTSAGNFCQMWTNAVGLGNLGVNPTPATNRCRVEITCTQTGSISNMSYVVLIDQGDTGTFNVTNSGAGLNFGTTQVGLALGTRNQPQTFIQNQPNIAIAALAATNTVAGGTPVTFSTSLTAGWPVSTAQQWYSNGIPIAGATALSYTTAPVTSAYNGARYSIVVSNQLNSANVVTSSVVLLVRSTPGIVPFNFAATTVAAGGGTVTDPGVAISGSSLLAGDTVVFDGIITPNGSQLSDAWTSVDIAGSGYGNLFGTMAVLCRMGPAANPSQLFINGTTIPANNPTSSQAPINRVRIELYPSANGSTTNMGWLVEIDQNLSGTFQPAVTGTNLTFASNTLPLTFGSSGSSSFVVQNPQSPVAIFSGPATNQVLAVGTPITLGVTVEGWYPAFQWYKFNGLSYQPILNATNRNYTSPPATISDNGDKFYVVVSNKLNSLNVVTSSVANVAVLIPNNLTWYPAADGTTWDSLTANWTTNGGASETLFSGGNNVTLDSLGYNIGGNFVTVSNTVNPNAVTVNASSFDQYQWLGTGNISGQSLLLTGDGTGTLELQTTASFTSATITNATLQIGYLAVDGALQANYITNYGTINFNNAGGLTIAGVFSGPGPLFQNGSGLTALTATNSAYTIGTISSGTLAIASTPNPGIITNNSALQPNSPASVLTIPNAMTGTGFYDLSGFQTTVLTGISSHTGRNTVVWSDVIVNNPWALGDTNVGSTEVFGADKFGGLYFSNSIVWSQLLQLDTRQNTGAEATAPHVANFNGNNVITGPLIFATGSAAGNYGTELNVEATTGQLTIAAASSLTNNTISGHGSANLNLQGPATGIWYGNLADGATPLNVVKRGTGTWTLGGSNVNSGTTTVSSGTLLITGQIGTNDVLVSGGTLGGNGGTIAGAVSVAAGATLAPGGTGAGTLTINNNLTLASGSFTSVNINKTTPSNDQTLGVNTLTYGGTLVVNNLAGTLTTSDFFPLFSATNYAGTFAAISPATPGAGLAWNTNTLTTDGILRITTGIAMNRTNITAKVVSGYLQLSWPADHTGWRLLEQTNNLNKGVSTNILADWGTVAGSQLVNSTNITIIKTNLNEYFQLVYP